MNYAPDEIIAVCRFILVLHKRADITPTSSTRNEG